MDCSPPGSSARGILQARILKWVAISFSRGFFPDPGIEHRSPALQTDSLPAEPSGKTYRNLHFPKFFLIKNKTLLLLYTFLGEELLRLKKKNAPFKLWCKILNSSSERLNHIPINSI